MDPAISASPGDPFGFTAPCLQGLCRSKPSAQDAEKSGGLYDLDPELGRQRGQEPLDPFSIAYRLRMRLMALLNDGPLSKASSIRDPPGPWPS